MTAAETAADTYEITEKDVALHNKNVVRPPTLTAKAIGQYLLLRPKSLFITKDEWNEINWGEVVNPFKPLYNMNRHQWNMFGLGLVAWTWDAFDYFITSLNLHAISKQLNCSVEEITWGMTLVLMFRSLGAVLGGVFADAYSKRWAYIVIMILLSVLQIGTANVHSYALFLAVKALFGIAMGSVYGVAMSTALDDADKLARGVLSGLYQEGYALGKYDFPFLSVISTSNDDGLTIKQWLLCSVTNRFCGVGPRLTTITNII